MEKKELIKLGLLYIVVLFFAILSDMSGGLLGQDDVIEREDVGGDSIEVDLILDVGDVLNDHEVFLEIEPTQITKEEADAYFEEAMKRIDEDFKRINREIPLKKAYEKGLVEAEWSFTPAGLIASDGTIAFEQIPENGVIAMANVILECGAYETIYTFPFKILSPEWTVVEKIEQELEAFISNQQKKEGTNEFELPKELGGLPTTWKEEKEYISLKILFLEVASVILLIFAKKKEQENLLHKRRYERELQYPELVNQLLILMEAGMTTRQAWHRIAYQYNEKRKKNLVKESEVYAAIVQMERRLAEGENERSAYDNFVMQMDSMYYRRLMRLLINNLEKGSKDICQQLNVEAKQAYEQRLLLAKKRGEEASTKMLIPMMLMMLLVMVIIMAPAMMGFAA